MAIAIMKAPSKSAKPEDVRQMKNLGEYVIQRKYDGSRHLWLNGHLVSERGIIKDGNFPQIFNVLKGCMMGGWTLDMEIYIEGGTVLDLNKHENQCKAKACVFDIIYDNKNNTQSVDDRIKTLKDLFAWRQIDTNIVHMPETFDDFESGWKKVMEKGWEGLMLKLKNSVYVFGRSNAWVKVKNRDNIDVPILRHEPGKLAGTFIVRMPSGVEARVGGKDVYCVEQYKKHKYKMMEMSFLYLTADGFPFQPVLEKFKE